MSGYVGWEGPVVCRGKGVEWVLPATRQICSGYHNRDAIGNGVRLLAGGAKDFSAVPSDLAVAGGADQKVPQVYVRSLAGGRMMAEMLLIR